MPADRLGITHSHEHILWDYFDLIMSYDVIFDDELVATDEVGLFAAAGGGTLVDCTTTGLGPRPEALRRISERTGVNIVLGCGWYREKVYHREVFERTSSELGNILIRHLTEGFDGTDVRAGFIGEIGTERGSISPAEERVFRAAAKASLATGAAILTHTTHFGELALEQIDLLEESGVQPDRIVVSHLGDREDAAHLLRIADRGVYLSIDNIGYENDGYPSDDVRLRNISTLIKHGHADRIVLGTDIATRSALATYGGRGYAWLIEDFIPKMRAAGISDAHIEAATTSNIASALSRS
ncbi:phosphotriesterase family protein [Plantibacter sp. YIM 135249]|uniref:phosphotriesterase family protein n=1 Tax=Plantibacter sp. YIM 135249 TaxID=3423918 RepID=UPI003D33DFEB